MLASTDPEVMAAPLLWIFPHLDPIPFVVLLPALIHHLPNHLPLLAYSQHPLPVLMRPSFEYQPNKNLKLKCNIIIFSNKIELNSNILIKNMIKPSKMRTSFVQCEEVPPQSRCLLHFRYHFRRLYPLNNARHYHHPRINQTAGEVAVVRPN